MIHRLYRLTGALHPAAIGDGFVVPLFESEDDRDRCTYVQRGERDVIAGFDPVQLDEDDVVISTNTQRHMAVGDRPLRGFRSRSAGLLIGNVFYLRTALREIQSDYSTGSTVRRLIDTFLAEHPDALRERPIAADASRGRILPSASPLPLPPPASSVRARSTDRKGTFVTEPLDRGYGLTLGNALRRVLLTSIDGHAVTAIRIDNVLHEFSTLEGMHQDVTDLVLNMKQLVVRLSGATTQRLRLEKTGPARVTGADIGAASGVEIVNPDLVLCTLDPGIELGIDIFVAAGKGYVPAAENRPGDAAIGLIPVDALFSPVRQVSYKVDPVGMGADHSFDKLTMTIETDGSLSPEEALADAAKILQSHLNVYVPGADASGGPQTATSLSHTSNNRESRNAMREAVRDITRFLYFRVDNLELSLRSANCLEAANIVYVGDLAKITEAEALRIPNMGRKSVNELKEVLSSMGLQLGMDLPGWPPEDVEGSAAQFDLQSK